MSDITSIKEKSERLYQVRRELAALDEAHKKATEGLNIEKDVLQREVIEEMEAIGVASLKVSSGDTFTKAIRRSVAVTNPLVGLVWAKENNAVSIDSRLIAQKVKDGVTLPDAFEVRETPYISVRKAK